MTEKCYSMDKEHFYDDIDGFIDEYFESGVFDIWEGEKVPHTITDFINFDSICEQIVESAEDECGESAEDYFYYRFTEEDQKRQRELEKSFFAVVEKWATDNGLQPKFYGVKNVKKIRVRIDVENRDYEIIK